MLDWTESSKRVSEFVDKFLDRALGTTNDPAQRVIVYDTPESKLYLGKLMSEATSASGSGYKTKVAPCSYIATFLVKGKPPSLRLRITPSFNLYFRSAIHKIGGGERDVDPQWLDLYLSQADPPLPAVSGRDDMWRDWREQMRSVPQEFTAAVSSLEAPKNVRGRLRGMYDPDLAIDAYIRKRYCTHFDIVLSSNGNAKEALDLDQFREVYMPLGRAPEWSGQLEVNVLQEEDTLRLTVRLTNTFSKKTSPGGDPHWYDTHLRIEVLDGLEVKSVPCPVLDQAKGQVPEVAAESKNCAFDELTSTANVLTFSPVARVRTIRRSAREVPFSFLDSAQQPQLLLEQFYDQMKAHNASAKELEQWRKEITLLSGDSRAVEAIGMIARVYAKSIGKNGQWRLHQLATLIRSAAMYLAREGSQQVSPKPLILNVPTAGGKTEAFFAAAMFCAFYELLRRRRSVNIIKYPMTLLSSDQIARLSKYSMLVDEVALERVGKPLGIGYMVGKKDYFDEPRQIIERCPYPLGEDGEICGESWDSYTLEGGIPKLTCPQGHALHLGIDKGEMLTRQCPAFVIAIWDKFVSQSGQRRLGLLFGADRYVCSKHGTIDFAETNQGTSQKKSPTGQITCQVLEGGKPCDAIASRAASVLPGVTVYDEGHLIRESTGTLNSHYETTYLQIAQDLSRRQPISIVSTATIAGIADFLEQLGLVRRADSESFYIIPPAEDQENFFQILPGEMQHEVLALSPFDVMLTWAVPDLIDVFFETLTTDYGFDATNLAASPPSTMGHLRQVMVYCSNYKNISALAEMNRNAVAVSRQRRGRAILKTLQLSARYFSRVKAQMAINDVRNMRQQIIYATNIASIGIDIDNLDVIFFFGLPSNVSEFIQAMNRTGRRPDKPAVCVAILGPNKERDMSYYRY